jgi:hypothetical protein
MAELRFSALREVFNRVPVEFNPPSKIVSEYFGENVFDLPKMERFLSKEAYKIVKRAINEGKSLSRLEADMVATGLKAWAIGKGATHYTHWFHPLTDGTAEKHDGFIEMNFLFSRSQTHPAFQAVGYAIPLKQEVILPGMFRHLFLLLEPLCVFQQYLYRTREKLSTIRRPFLKHCRSLTELRLMYASISIRM